MENVKGQFEKGKRAAAIGEKRMFGGKEYVKTATGWRPVGKGKKAGGGEDSVPKASGPIGGYKVEAGHSVTTDEGHHGTVKHQDETHTYIEHKTADGKSKVSKVKNEDLEANVKGGKWQHHTPVKQEEKKEEKKEKKEKKGSEGKVIGKRKDGSPIYENVNKNLSIDDEKDETTHTQAQFDRHINGVGGWGGGYDVTHKGKKVSYKELADKLKPGESTKVTLTHNFAKKRQTVMDERGKPVFFEQSHKTDKPLTISKDEKGQVTYTIDHHSKSNHSFEKPKVSQNSWDKEEGKTPIDVKNGKIIYKEGNNDKANKMFDTLDKKGEGTLFTAENSKGESLELDKMDDGRYRVYNVDSDKERFFKNKEDFAKHAHSKLDWEQN